jgi:hypothetical protein
MRNLLGATLLSGLVTLALPAHATLINWDFSDGGILDNTDIGTNRTFNTDGFLLTADGLTGLHGGPTDMFFKLGSAINERGLGIKNDPSGEHEINGKEVIQINVAAAVARGVTGFDFSMESSTQGERWSVDGVNGSTLTPLFVKFSDEGVVHNLAGGFSAYDFFYSGAPRRGGGKNGCGVGCDANVLLGSFGGTAPVPEPTTWTMIILGFGMMAFMGARKVRKDRFNALA